MFKQNIPYLSHIQHTEAVRTLPLHRRMLYMVLSLMATLVSFMALVLIAVGLAFLAFNLLIGGSQSMGDQFLLVSAVVCTFMVAIGFTSNPIPRQLAPGDTLAACVNRNFRRGLWIGLIIGFTFGLIWILTVRISGFYVQLNTFFGQQVYLDEILLYAVVIAIATTPTFALFRALFSAIGHWSLGMVMQDTRAHAI